MKPDLCRRNGSSCRCYSSCRCSSSCRWHTLNDSLPPGECFIWARILLDICFTFLTRATGQASCASSSRRVAPLRADSRLSREPAALPSTFPITNQVRSLKRPCIGPNLASTRTSAAPSPACSPCRLTKCPTSNRAVSAFIRYKVPFSDFLPGTAQVAEVVRLALLDSRRGPARPSLATRGQRKAPFTRLRECAIACNTCVLLS